VRALLRSLLDAAQSRQVGIRRDDPEALHDLRVAVRRARCLLGQVDHVVDEESARRLRAELRWLGAATGPLREREVLLQRFESMRSGLPADEGAAFAATTRLLRHQRDVARRELLEALASARHRRLLDAWESLGAEPSRAGTAGNAPAAEATRDGARPVVDVAARAIDRAWRRLLRRGRAISAGDGAPQLHRVRIDGKKLRYLIELFSSAYPEIDLEPTLDDLKQLQDCLGDVNDAAQREQALRALGLELAAQGGDGDLLLVTGRWIERARVEGARARAEFVERFASLTTKENRRRLRALAG
jgi:CHAD domain-containing protein